MKAFVSALLVASVALGEAPDAGVNADAPRAVVLEAGQPAPSTGMFLPEAVAIASEKDRQACHVERDALQKTPSVAVLIVVGVLLAGAGVAVGYGVAQIRQP